MGSISSKTNIKKRTNNFWKEHKIWHTAEIADDLKIINSFLHKEYALIPEKERVGKGSVFIAKTVSEAAINFLLTSQEVEPLEVIRDIFRFSDPEENNHMKNFAIALLGELVYSSKEYFSGAITQTKVWGDHSSWKVREMSGQVLRKALQKYPEKTITILSDWVHSDNENIRRLAVESLRPLSVIKWLRDPTKNDKILTLLSIVKADPSMYVRKSVGNNLKDLTKYMPEKILDELQVWIQEANVLITDDLASKSKKELGEEIFHLIWTVKHALRWLQKRNPGYHQRIEVILGKNYVLYFDEKRNKRAIRE